MKHQTRFNTATAAVLSRLTPLCLLALLALQTTRAADPVLVGHWPEDPYHDAAGLAVSGNHAFLLMDGDLHILEVNGSASIRRLATYTNTYGYNYAASIAISDRYAYMAFDEEDREGELDVFDISNLQNPLLVGWYNTPDSPLRVAMAGDLVLLACTGAGLQIISATAPTNLVPVGSSIIGYAVDLAISGNLAFVVDDDWGLQIYDVADPHNPLELGEYIRRDSALAVAVSGNYAYMSDDEDGLIILDVSNPGLPVRVGTYAANVGLGLAVSGNLAFLYANGGLEMIDVSNPANPVRVAGPVPTPEIRRIAVSGDYVYATGTGGLSVYQFAGFSPALRVSHDNGRLSLQIHGEPGRQYVVEGASMLSASNNWTAMTTFTLTNNPQLILDITAPNDAQRFYRARLVPSTK